MKNETIEERIEKLLALKRRNDLMLLMRRAGYSYEEIGRHFGLTKQRVHQILSEIENQHNQIVNR